MNAPEAEPTSIVAFAEKALGWTLEDKQRELLLVMFYGIIGDMKKAHALLDEAIGKDPEVPVELLQPCMRLCGRGRQIEGLNKPRPCLPEKSQRAG